MLCHRLRPSADLEVITPTNLTGPHLCCYDEIGRSSRITRVDEDRCGVALHRAGQADAERLRREL